MTELRSIDKLEEILRGTANVAGSLQSKVGFFTLLGFIASVSIAWMFYSSESSFIWNLVKCGTVLMPAMVLTCVWLVLGKVVDAPKQISMLANEEGLISNLQKLGIKKPDSFRGLISTVRAIRNEDGLGSITEAIGGIVLLSNPVFLLFAFISLAILIVLIIIAPFVLIF